MLIYMFVLCPPKQACHIFPFVQFLFMLNIVVLKQIINLKYAFAFGGFLQQFKLDKVR